MYKLILAGIICICSKGVLNANDLIESSFKKQGAIHSLEQPKGMVKIAKKDTSYHLPEVPYDITFYFQDLYLYMYVDLPEGIEAPDTHYYYSKPNYIQSILKNTIINKKNFLDSKGNPLKSFEMNAEAVSKNGTSKVFFDSIITVLDKGWLFNSTKSSKLIHAFEFNDFEIDTSYIPDLVIFQDTKQTYALRYKVKM